MEAIDFLLFFTKWIFFAHIGIFSLRRNRKNSNTNATIERNQEKPLRNFRSSKARCTEATLYTIQPVMQLFHSYCYYYESTMYILRHGFFRSKCYYSTLIYNGLFLFHVVPHSCNHFDSFNCISAHTQIYIYQPGDI